MYQTVTSDKEKKCHTVKFNQLNRNLQVHLPIKIIFLKILRCRAVAAYFKNVIMHSEWT